MTDYLEWVLGEDEEEREENSFVDFAADSPLGTGGKGERPLSPLRGQPPGRGSRGTRRVKDAVPYEMGNAEKAGTAPAQPAALEGPRLEERGGTRRMRNAAPYGGEIAGRDAEGRIATAALVARIRRTETAAGYRSAPSVFPETAGTVTEGYGLLPALDAAVRRDARRYDGGFELF